MIPVVHHARVKADRVLCGRPGGCLGILARIVRPVLYDDDGADTGERGPPIMLSLDGQVHRDGIIVHTARTREHHRRDRRGEVDVGADWRRRNDTLAFRSDRTLGAPRAILPGTLARCEVCGGLSSLDIARALWQHPG